MGMPASNICLFLNALVRSGFVTKDASNYYAPQRFFEITQKAELTKYSRSSTPIVETWGDAFAAVLMDARGYGWSEVLFAHPGVAVGHLSQNAIRHDDRPSSMARDLQDE